MKNMLEEELIKTGCRYNGNEDGSYNVEYNGYAVTVSEDEEDWCLNYIKTPEGNILPYSEEEYDVNFLMGANGTGYNEYSDDSELDESGEPAEEQIDELKEYLNDNYNYLPECQH